MELKQIIQKRTVQYDIVSKKFKDVNIKDKFFNSFREAYDPYFSEWIKKKENDNIFVVEKNQEIIGFLKIKIEEIDEDYSDISPSFTSKRRLKICSLKVKRGILGLSNKLMELVLSLAIFNSVREIYVTIPILESHASTVNFVKKRYNFQKYGIKESHGICEYVFVKSL